MGRGQSGHQQRRRRCAHQGRARRVERESGHPGAPRSAGRRLARLAALRIQPLIGRFHRGRQLGLGALGPRCSPAEGRRAHLGQSLGKGSHGVRSGVRQDQHELIAADPICTVRLAQTGPQRIGQGAQCSVPGGMSLGVIETLEAVHVDRHDGQWQSRSARLGGTAAKVRGQSPAVPKAGQRVEQRLVLKSR